MKKNVSWFDIKIKNLFSKLAHQKCFKSATEKGEYSLNAVVEEGIFRDY